MFIIISLSKKCDSSPIRSSLLNDLMINKQLLLAQVPFPEPVVKYKPKFLR